MLDGLKYDLGATPPRAHIEKMLIKKVCLNKSNIYYPYKEIHCLFMCMCILHATILFQAGHSMMSDRAMQSSRRAEQNKLHASQVQSMCSYNTVTLKIQKQHSLMCRLTLRLVYVQ